MKQTFFRTLIATALVSSFSVALFLTLIMLFYKNPLNSVPKGFDWLFFLGFPVWAMLYYKLKVNNKTLIFQEGMVLGALVSFTMLLSLNLVVLITYGINHNILDIYIQDWITELITNKKLWIARLKTEKDYESLMNSYKSLTIGQYLFKESAAKMMLLFLVSVVGATAFRGEPKPITTKKAKK
ncbi:hypothetical protein AD998_02790 [bacterium 336/3]|jgi:hypothetical protein|nr:hypothetical protein AD998_02790 [bacterium 336/3]